ncbi:hypothetical protein [Panacagrimonas perspica]|uniref:hypothetical protein n=1 Tax=Panacagrimonas perspica TaxID=381431 RepID=UPI0013C36A55|nr:hypothetical protein [Panacagrimonas perspica]
MKNFSFSGVQAFSPQRRKGKREDAEKINKKTFATFLFPLRLCGEDFSGTA